MIYLDNGATTYPKPRAVTAAVSNTLLKKGANPGRSGHDMSMMSAEIIYNCRKNIADFFDADSPENVVFTLNCTTALNTVIKGLLGKGDHAVISSLEHNAVLRPLESLKSRGVSYSVAEYVPYDDEKTIDNFRKAINDKTKLVICTHASNVFGYKLPVQRIGALCKIYGILFCVDSAQSAGVVPISLKDSGIDFLCTAGHKGLYGPMGTGVLVINNSETSPQSLIQGGTGSMSHQRTQPEILPDKYESGTPNLSGIAGLNEGINFVRRKGIENIENYEIMLAQKLYDRLSRIDSVILYTKRPDKKYSVPVISFNVNGIDSEDVALQLNNYNIAVRSGLHCAPLAHESAGTIDTGTVRVVVSIFNKEEELYYFIKSLEKIIKLKKPLKKVEINN